MRYSLFGFSHTGISISGFGIFTGGVFILFKKKSGFHILISGNHLCHVLLNTSCDSGSDKPNDITTVDFFFSLFLIRNYFSFPSPASPT